MALKRIDNQSVGTAVTVLLTHAFVSGEFADEQTEGHHGTEKPTKGEFSALAMKRAGDPLTRLSDQHGGGSADHAAAV
jgi:hypothetical protein